MTIAAGSHLGSYEVLAPIGSGGMGEVYQAHDTKLGRDVAIKVLPKTFAHDPGRLSRFQHEAKISGDVLQHHLNGRRNGLYVDPLITQKAATTHREKAFNAPLLGQQYPAAAPLRV
jgi:serine/threonine protein kinase